MEMSTESDLDLEASSSLSVDDLSESLKQFKTLDYAVFIAMLLCCSCVGLYFGYEDHMKHKRSKRNRRGSLIDVEAIDYLMGGRNMKVFPVAMSLVASFISGITLLGTSTEIYLYGTQYCYILTAIFTSGTVMHFIIIPIFHELQITSTYEYLQYRFDKHVRLYASLMFSLSTMMWMPIVIYVPALAFNQTTGINIHITTPIVMSICIFYTCLGGIKAVVWTDVIQMILMYGTLFIIVIKGTLNVGGLSVVIDKNSQSERFEAPDFRLDPTIRHTFWTLFVGGSIYWIGVTGFNQNMIQRYMSLKDVATARKGQFLYLIGVAFMILLCCYNGLLLVATYYGCDPLQTKLAKAKDQMMPLLVMDILKDIPGLPGLFIAGVFSAALSSLSTGLNSMSCVILEDFCKPFIKRDLSEQMTSLIMRGTVLVLGVVSVGLVYVVQHMGSVLQLSMSLPTACFGPMVGVYFIGFAIPWIGKKATLLSGIIASSLMIILVFKAQSEMALGNIKFQTKPLSVDGCTYDFTMSAQNSSITDIPIPHEHREKHIYEISYLYYTTCGSLIVIVSAFILSFLFGFQDPSQVDQRLLVPFLRKYISSSSKAHHKDTNGKEAVIHNFDMKETNKNVLS